MQMSSREKILNMKGNRVGGQRDLGNLRNCYVQVNNDDNGDREDDNEEVKDTGRKK